MPYFSKTKRKSTKTITQQCLSCQNNSVCQKLAQSCKKQKSAQNVTYALFAQNPSIMIMILPLFTRRVESHGSQACLSVRQWFLRKSGFKLWHIQNSIFDLDRHHT